MSLTQPPDLDRLRADVRAVLAERLDLITLYPAAVVCSITSTSYRIHRDTLDTLSPIAILSRHIRALEPETIRPSAWVALARVVFDADPVAGPAALEAPNTVHCLLSSYAIDHGRPMEFFA
jgi:hypothetical protein